MIRKSTLIVLVVAVLLGGGVYYYQKKHAPKDDASTTNPSKPVFSIQSADIQSITVQHLPASDSPIQIARQGDNWQLTSPLHTAADSSSVQGIVDGVAEASYTQTEPSTPDRLKAYGLDPGALSIDFTLKNGAKHHLLLGNKDFTGDSVYALVDSNSQVILLPNSLLTSSDKTADDLRDHAILHLNSDQVSVVELKNSSGDAVLKKSSSGWDMTKPDTAPGDSDAVSALISAVSTGKMMSVASETANDLGKYGLSSPAATIALTNDIGKSSTLIVGKKQGDNYYAQDTSRPTIFEVNDDLYKKLTQAPSALLDKVPMHVDETDINKIEIQGSNGPIAASRQAEENWVFDQPDAQKGKAASAWKIFSALSVFRADDVIEKPGAEVVAALAQPAYQLILTDNGGKKRTLRVTKAIGDFIYAQSSDGPAVYKFKKASLSDLDLKPADLAAS
jgi:hypothetical protein